MSADKQDELRELLDRARDLEREILAEDLPLWKPTGFYGAYYATTGFLLGIFGAMTSLLVNVIGAPIVRKSPLELIRVYLTFPLGEKALSLARGAENIYAVPDGLIIAFGCCLYLATGMIVGVPFQVLMMKWAGDAPLSRRLFVGTCLALGMWLINFYGILIWLQPVLLGGDWITDPQILPWWVAAATHLVYGWTMAALAPLGQYSAYQPATPSLATNTAPRAS